LKDDLGLPVTDLFLPESGGAAGYLIIALGKHQPWQPAQVIHGALAIAPMLGKVVILVDDDIDIRDHAQVEWAVSFRMRPDRDVQIIRNVRAVGLAIDQVRVVEDEGGLLRLGLRRRLGGLRLGSRRQQPRRCDHSLHRGSLREG
jgi:3-polyprenyl-4-hydroxybenzoate decarboxylase